MPEGVGVFVDHQIGIITSSFLTRNKSDTEGYILYLCESLFHREFCIILKPSLDGTAIAQIEGRFIHLRLSTIDGVKHSAISFWRIDAYFSNIATSHTDGLLSRRCHLNCCIEIVVRHWTHNEPETISATIYAVVRERSTLSAAISSESSYFCVEMDVGSIGSWQLIGVSRSHELEVTPRQSRSTHGAIRHEGYTLSGFVGESTPAHILAVTHRLRFGEHNVLFAHNTLVTFNELSGLTVGIVIDWSATIISEVAVILRHFKGITQTRQFCLWHI